MARIAVGPTGQPDDPALPDLVSKLVISRPDGNPDLAPTRVHGERDPGGGE